MKKRKTYQTGRSAELLCIICLMLKGYRILDWRFRSYAGEIDIVAQKRNMLAFVEVKARPSRAQGMDAVSATAQKRIESAATDYIQKKTNRAKFAFRFDLMIVMPRRWPIHIPNAW